LLPLLFLLFYVGGMLFLAFWVIPLGGDRAYVLASRYLGANTRIEDSLLTAPPQLPWYQRIELYRLKEELLGKCIRQAVEAGEKIEQSKVVPRPDVSDDDIVEVTLESEPDWMLLNQGATVEVWLGQKLATPRYALVEAIVGSDKRIASDNASETHRASDASDRHAAADKRWIALVRRSDFVSDVLNNTSDKLSLRLVRPSQKPPLSPPAPAYVLASRYLGANTRISAALLTAPPDMPSSQLIELDRLKKELDGKYVRQPVEFGAKIEVNNVKPWPDLPHEDIVAVSFESEPDWMLLNQGATVEVWLGQKLATPRYALVEAIVGSDKQWIALVRRSDFASDALNDVADKPSLRLVRPPQKLSLSQPPPAYVVASRYLGANTRLTSAMWSDSLGTPLSQLVELDRLKKELDGKYIRQPVEIDGKIDPTNVAPWPEVSNNVVQVTLEREPDWMLLNQGSTVEVRLGQKLATPQNALVEAIVPSGKQWIALVRRSDFACDVLSNVLDNLSLVPVNPPQKPRLLQPAPAQPPSCKPQPEAKPIPKSDRGNKHRGKHKAPRVGRR
jgi:hypothetical protein